MHCKPELNPRTQEEQPLHLQPLAYSECWQHPRYMQRAKGLVLLFISVVTPRYGAVHVCTHLQSLPAVGKIPGWGPPPQDALQLSTQGHGYFPYGAYVHMAFLLQNRLNSTVMSLGMLLPARRTRDRSQCCYRSEPAKAAVGEHLSSKLTVEMWPVSWSWSQPPLPCWDGTWHLPWTDLGTHKAMLQFVPVFNILE